MNNDQLIHLLILLLLPLIRAQATTPTTATAPSPTTDAQAAPSGGDVNCSWEGSVSEYAKCQKGKVSTTTLIASGIGVTVAILALVGLGVWLCNRQRRSRMATKRIEEGDEVISTNKPSTSRADSPRYNSADETEEEQPRDEKRPVKRFDDNPAYPNKIPSDPRAARVESGSSSSGSVATPPPPHPAHIVPKPALPSEIINSPVEETTTRSLYPSNPSPMPRHLRPSPQAESRSSSYSKRQSIASVHANAPIEGVPPMPIATRSNTGTPPLNIRKSTFDAAPPRQTKRGDGAIPTYYEATKGQEGVPRPISKVPRQSVSMYGRSASAPDNAPPIPLALRPGLDARRPSAPANPTLQRKMTERGGLI